MEQEVLLNAGSSLPLIYMHLCALYGFQAC